MPNELHTSTKSQSTKTIFGCNQKLPIGYRGKGVTDFQKKRHPEMPFVILAESTFEEWLAYYHENCSIPLTAQDLADSKYDYFYELSID